MNTNNKLCIFSFFMALLGLHPNSINASAPNWAVDTKAFQGTMTVTGIIEINGLKGKSAEDMVAVFVGDVCRGVAKPIYNKTLDRYLVFLSAFGNETTDTLSYKIYIAAEDRIYAGRENLVYNLNAALGKIDEPYLFRNATASEVASIPNVKAFNIYPNPLRGDQLAVALQLQRVDTELQLTVSDVLGRVVWVEKTGNSSSGFTRTLDFSGWDAGIYLLSISDGKGVLSKKIVRY